jgi:hypothetical protein
MQMRGGKILAETARKAILRGRVTCGGVVRAPAASH